MSARCRRIAIFFTCGMMMLAVISTRVDAQETTGPWPEHIQGVIDNTKPLKFDRGKRLPLYLWPAMNPGILDDPKAEKLVRLLDERGVGLVSSWNHRRVGDSLAACLPVARAQKKLGLRVNVNANAPLYGFFDGSEETAHLDQQGKPFFDDSFGKKKMGCPFRLEHRIGAIRERIETFVQAYEKAGVPIDFVFADWEIDGPIEWNEAHAKAKHCKVCRENLPDIDDFLIYQDALRRIRSRLQRLAYAEPILKHFPNALVGNYAVYPHDGWRYWWDYFEHFVEGQPVRMDQRARYRHWANDFGDTSYSFAMRVVYPWSWWWGWYDFKPGDYRWFYNGLLVAGNAGRHTPADVPIISFVHWHTVDVGPKDAPKPDQMTEWAYQELLWHMLLRGTDAFFMWCRGEERAKEVQVLHPVWAAAQEYGEFLDKGIPVNFDVPSQPGPVISGLRMGNKVLVRRTDFAESREPVAINVAGRELAVPVAPGRCQILSLEK